MLEKMVLVLVEEFILPKMLKLVQAILVKGTIHLDTFLFPKFFQVFVRMEVQI